MNRIRACLLILTTLFAAACTGRRPASGDTGKTEQTRQAEQLSSEADPAAGTNRPAVDTLLKAAAVETDPTPGIPFVENDTVFLYKASAEGANTRAFVVRDRLSKAFRELYDRTSFHTLDAWNRNAFEEGLKALRQEAPGPLPAHVLEGCPATWIPLRTLHGRHYVDMLSVFPIWIADTLFIHQFYDGPLPGRIEASEKVSPTHFRLRIAGPCYGPTGQNVDIHLIDPVRKIAVIVFRTDVEYALLYAARETIDQVDLVDWICTEQPPDDAIAWDDIDYLTLIPAEADADPLPPGEGTERLPNDGSAHATQGDPTAFSDDPADVGPHPRTNRGATDDNERKTAADCGTENEGGDDDLPATDVKTN